MNKPDILAALFPLINVFQKLGITYHIGGSVASSAYGIARATLDIDIVADVGPHHLPALAKALQSSYYIEDTAVKAAIEHHASFNLIHLETLLKIDIFILKNTPYDRLAFSRKRSDRLVEDDDRSVFDFASSEDVVLNKLVWYRMGDGVSDRQWFDILGVLKVQHDTIDREYLYRWAPELGVSDLLDKAFTDATNNQQ
jgi:hypothetical protein